MGGLLAVGGGDPRSSRFSVRHDEGGGIQLRAGGRRELRPGPRSERSRRWFAERIAAGSRAALDIAASRTPRHGVGEGLEDILDDVTMAAGQAGAKQ